MDAPRTVFMGTPDFAVPSLDALVAADLAPIAVVTTPDRRSGRGRKVSPSPVKEAAQRHGIPVLQPADLKDSAFADELSALRPDVLAVVAFRILPPAVYETARLAAFNLHGSLLPAYRGAAPIQRALMDGVAETGVTTFVLQKRVDTGNVILRRPLAVGPDDTFGDVHDRLSEIGAEAVVETVRRVAEGDLSPEPQNDAQATAAPKIFREDAEIDWDRPAPVVHNHVRGLSPVPGAWTVWQDEGAEPETLKVFRTAVASGPSAAPGTVRVEDGRMWVACAEGAVEVLEAQRPGKRRMDTADLLNGADLDGARLG